MNKWYEVYCAEIGASCNTMTVLMCFLGGCLYYAFDSQHAFKYCVGHCESSQCECYLATSTSFMTHWNTKTYIFLLILRK